MRLFTGMPLPVSFKEAASILQKTNQPADGLRWTVPQNLHVTSFFIGEVPPADLSGIKGSIARLTKDFRPVTLCTEKICLWPERKPYMIWVLFNENEEFTRLYRTLESDLTGQAGRGSVKPHITLARFKDFTETGKINLAATSLPGELMIDHLVLFESRLASSGPTYFPIDNYVFG